MRLSTLSLLVAISISIPSIIFAQYDIRIGSAASSGGSWSGGNPDIWTGDGAVNPDRTVNKDEIVSRLNAGISVTIFTTYGSIADSAGIAIWKTSGGDAVLLLKASTSNANSSNITFGRNDTIASTGGRLTIIINSDADGSGDGFIATEAAINTGCYFASNGGDIVMGGGTDPSLTSAYGSTATAGGTPGVSLQGMTMIAGTGAISIRGHGTLSQAGTTVGNSTLIRTTSGAIGVYGTGGNDVVGGTGLSITDDGTTIQTDNGAVTINGIGGVGTTISGTGIFMADASTIISVDGAMNFTGSGTNGVGAGAHGMWMSGKDRNDPAIQTVNGTITINATAGSASTTTDSTSMVGMGMEHGAVISATGTGSIVITATGASGAFQKNLYGLYLYNTQSSKNSIETNTGNISIRAVAGAGATGGSAGLFMWGGAGRGSRIYSVKGNITIHATSANGSHGMWCGNGVYVRSSGNIDVTADVAGAGTSGSGLYLYNEAQIVASDSGSLTINATGAAGGGTSTGITLTGGIPFIGTTWGSLTVNATGGGNSGTGSHGIEMTGGSFNSYAGRVVINATAGFAGSGIYIHSTAGTEVKTGGGNLLINATARGDGNFPGMNLSYYNYGTLGSDHGDTCWISATGSGTGPAIVGNSYSQIGISSFAGEMIIEGDGQGSDQIDLSNCPIAGKGNFTIRPKQAASTIGLGGGSGSFNLSFVDVARFSGLFKTITIGRSDGTGAMTVLAYTFGTSLTLKTGSGAIAINGALSVGANNLTIASDGIASQTAAITAGQLTLTGTGAFDFSTRNNTIGTLFADAPIVKLRDDGGIVVGRLNAAEAALFTNTAFTETADLSVARLTLGGSAAYSLSDTLQKLTLSGTASLILTGTTVTDTLVMEAGNITTGANTLSLGTNAVSPTFYSRTSGVVIGSFKRWVPAATVSTIEMPLGIASSYRGVEITYPSGTVSGGSVTGQFIAASPGTSGLQATDADGLVVQTLSPNGYWRVAAGDGFSGGNYILDLHADGFTGIADYTKVKIMKRSDSGSPWTFEGVHTAGTGSNAQPVAHRLGMSGFSEYGVGPSDVPMPVFSAERSSINFGAALVNTPKIDSIEIKNTGTMALNISSLTSDNSAFTCTQGDTVIAIGDSVTYYFTFTPASTGAAAGTLKIYHDAAGSPFSIAVTGRGLDAEPTLQASGMTITAVGRRSFTVNWTKGNGSNRIVLVCAGSSISALPADGTAYTANAQFGSGSQIGSGTYVVYLGTGATVNVTGLSSETTYSVAVIEANGSGATINYLTSAPLMGSQKTMATIFDTTAGHAMQFNGGSDCMTVPAAGLPSETGTVEFWIKIPVSGAGSDYRGLVSKYYDYGIFLLNNELVIYDWFMEAMLGMEYGIDGAAIRTGRYLNDDTWHHIAMTFWNDLSGTMTTSLYVDGEPTPIIDYGIVYNYGRSPLKIGAGDNIWSAGSLTGQIDEVKLWNTVRTLDQIRSDMHRTPSGDPSGLVAAYQFTEGTGTTVADPQGGYNGAISGSPSWIVSTAPVGKGVSTSTAGFSAGTVALGSASMTTADAFDAGVNVVLTSMAVSPSSLPAGSLSVLNDRYWIMTAYGAPGTYSANLTFTVPSEFTNGGSADAANYTLYQRGSNDDGPWTSIGNGAALTDTTLTFNGITSLGQFAIGTNETMPVELASFTAAAVNSGVSLSWKTATESNNYGFDVERRKTTGPSSSPEGVKAQWQKIGHVSGSGTSNAPVDYRFTDRNISAGCYAYRLKQIDRDGKFKYSQSVDVSTAAPKQFALFQNYPNPFNPETVIGYETAATVPVNLTVYDVLGKKIEVLVDEVKEAGSYEARFDASKYSTGIYFVRISAGSFTALKKMLLLR